MSLNRPSRRALRIDGIVRGARYSYRIAGETRPAVTGHASQFTPMTGYAANAWPEDYDPVHGGYVLPESRYDPLDPWDGAPSSAPSTAPFAPPAPYPPRIEPDIDDELAGWLGRRFVNEANSHCVDVQELFDPHHVPRMKIGEILSHLKMMHEYSDSVAAGQMVDALTDNYFIEPSPNQAWSDAVTQVAEGLESIAALMNEFGEPQDLPTPENLNAPALAPAEFAGPEPFMPETIPMDADPLAESLGHGPEATLEHIIAAEAQPIEPYPIPDPMEMLDPYGMPMPGAMLPDMPMNQFGAMLSPGFVAKYLGQRFTMARWSCKPPVMVAG